jgi:hypothetical protein
MPLRGFGPSFARGPFVLFAFTYTVYHIRPIQTGCLERSPTKIGANPEAFDRPAFTLSY